MTRPVHLVLFAAAVLLFVGLLTFFLVRATRRERVSESLDWETLLARLDNVNRTAVHAIAQDLIEGHDLIGPEEMFDMLNGLEGLERLESNCQVLIELATFVQRWQPQALLVADDLRLGARELKWHIERLRGASVAGHLKSTFPDNAARAVSVYYSMTRRVLNLYEDTAFGQLSALEQVL